MSALLIIFFLSSGAYSTFISEAFKGRLCFGFSKCRHYRYFLAAGAYSIVMENGPARQAGLAHQLQKAGDAVADMFEVMKK